MQYRGQGLHFAQVRGLFCKAKFDNYSKKGIANIGLRPTFNGKNIIRSKYIWN